ncbi:unnamed protein product [Danaus chrysippus]|uniref:(African queen) hypothetical protein n=1 Tax=Danaus chrysippus TaxID=151541 RepID=A0A8J2W4R2_9NEOP|nr:unnamed protein product [Danaus chrysippus]
MPPEEPPKCTQFGQQGHPANFRPQSPLWEKVSQSPNKPLDPTSIPAAPPPLPTNYGHRPRPASASVILGPTDRPKATSRLKPRSQNHHRRPEHSS